MVYVFCCSNNIFLVVVELFYCFIADTAFVVVIASILSIVGGLRLGTSFEIRGRSAADATLQDWKHTRLQRTLNLNRSLFLLYQLPSGSVHVLNTGMNS